MRYRLAIFDFDGTLADTFPWFMETVNQAADRFRFRRIDPDELDLLRGYEARRVMRHVGLPMWKLPQVARFMRGQMALDAGRIPLFPGVEPVLERLAAAGVRIAVVSSNSESNIRRVLGPRHAQKVLCFACGASLLGKRPKLRQVLKESGVAPEEALCIGDEIRDLHAARAERIPFGAVTWGFTRADALLAHSPEEVFHRVEEIADRLA